MQAERESKQRRAAFLDAGVQERRVSASFCGSVMYEWVVGGLCLRIGGRI